eukprot:822224-Pyramimonas_sp.AAC.1
MRHNIASYMPPKGPDTTCIANLATTPAPKMSKSWPKGRHPFCAPIVSVSPASAPRPRETLRGSRSFNVCSFSRVHGHCDLLLLPYLCQRTCLLLTCLRRVQTRGILRRYLRFT